MSLTISSSITAMAAGLTTSIGASGGTEPYVFSVVPGGAGGSINASTGLYASPLIASLDPRKAKDVIRVTDALGATASLSILVANALGLFCEIVQKEMGLADGSVYLYNQKIMQTTDSGLSIAVGVVTCKPFANNVKPDGSGVGLDAVQSINMVALLSLDIQSRSNEALFRKEEVLLALASLYSQSQQELNSFNIGKLPPGGQFVSLSNPDGAAIPFRFNISVNIQYFVRKIKAVPYFDDFADVSVTPEP